MKATKATLAALTAAPALAVPLHWRAGAARRWANRHICRAVPYCPMPEGRLADPDRTLGTDPRSDPRMVAAFAPFGLDGRVPPPLGIDSPLDERLALLAVLEEGFGAIFDTLA
jgi:hypothetical protein